jgi:hypothetical protein
MTTELSIYTDSASFQAVAEMTGAQVRNDVYLPRLTINRDPEDSEGNTVPVGQYCVTQDGNTVYAKNATFRVFLNAYQYQQYDPEVGKYTNRSIIFKNFNEEALDEKGGVACGKISRKLLEGASAEVLAEQKNIKCSRLMYGVVTLKDAVTRTGEKTEIVDMPVMYKLSGSNFLAPKVALDAITRMKHHYFQHNLILTPKRAKMGATIYYEVVVEPILNKEVQFSEEDLATFKLFQETIDRENRFVASKWKQTKQEAIKQDDVDISSALAFDDDVTDL